MTSSLFDDTFVWSRHPADVKSALVIDPYLSVLDDSPVVGRMPAVMTRDDERRLLLFSG